MVQKYSVSVYPALVITDLLIFWLLPQKIPPAVPLVAHHKQPIVPPAVHPEQSVAPPGAHSVWAVPSVVQPAQLHLSARNEAYWISALMS